jgi:hypothetical protein
MTFRRASGLSTFLGSQDGMTCGSMSCCRFRGSRNGRAALVDALSTFLEFTGWDDVLNDLSGVLLVCPHSWGSQDGIARRDMCLAAHSEVRGMAEQHCSMFHLHSWSSQDVMTR